jgi:hypothetical protein
MRQKPYLFSQAERMPATEDELSAQVQTETRE